jgi:hypothetical protein
MRTHVRRVSESGNGQKTVTIPKDSEIEDGDYIKLRKTRKWSHTEATEAVEKALDEMDESIGSDDPLEPDGVRDYSYLCGFQPENAVEPCALSFNSPAKVEQHFEDVHEEEFDEEKHLIEIYDVQDIFLPILVQKAVQYMGGSDEGDRDN